MINTIPKLIVTDWDGTFAEQGSTPTTEAIEAKDKLIANGSHIVLASGRSAKEVLKYVDTYKLSLEFIAELGTIIYYHGKEYINHGDLRIYEGQLHNEFTTYMDRENLSAHDAMFAIGVVDELIEIAQKHNMKFDVTTPKDGRPGQPGVNIMNKKGSIHLSGLVDTDILNNYLSRHAPFLELKDNGLVEDNSGRHAYHLLIKGANKESAVELLQKLMKVKKEETIALGDSLSDMTLVTVVNHFYLMRNGLDHTPDIFERFKKHMGKNFTLKEIDQILKKITVTDKPAGLGWAEVASKYL